MLRVLFVLAAFVVLYDCAQTSSPVENKVKQGEMKQEGKRAGDEQADPQRAAQPSKLDENKETQPSRGVKREQDQSGDPLALEHVLAPSPLEVARVRPLGSSRNGVPYVQFRAGAIGELDGSPDGRSRLLGAVGRQQYPRWIQS